ncbi:hypothetical protein AVEN_104623-1 [Araneus ventricosus]|uniref:Uncharacterized protein n=1 Tax=Araneus ventricosus TaxID=182803 RepID=A0A4Y2BD32_ARAVE|nr:hypothetical protein AVEN_104623-1 [Araneus ventricosus]
MCNMREFFHLKRCTICQVFGHLAKYCKDVRPTCGSCAGRHETRRRRSRQIVNVNCSDYSYCYGKEFEISYKASDNSCSCYHLKVAAYRRRRDY